MPSTKKRLLILTGVAVSVLFLWLSLRSTNFREVGEALSRANVWMGIPLLVAYMLYYWVKAIRWRMLLLPMKDTTAREVFSPMMIGFMGNNILPAHLGEFIRMYLGARALRLRQTLVLATIVLERLFDFLAVVFFLGVALIFSRSVSDMLVRTGYAVAASGLIILIIAIAYATWTERFLSAIHRISSFLPDKLRQFVLPKLETVALGLHAMKHPRLLVGVVVTSILQWALVGVCIYVSLLAVDIGAQFSSVFVVLAAMAFGVTLPAAPGFFGTIQLAFVVALTPFDVKEGDAVAASVFFHILTYVSVTLLGIVLLRRMGYKLSELQHVGEAADERVEWDA